MPPEVFTTSASQSGQYDARTTSAITCAKPSQLLKEAGYEIKDGELVNAKTGEPLKVEFLLVSPLIRAHRAALYRQSAAARHQGEPPHGRQRAIYAPRSTASTTTSSSAISRQSNSPGNEQRDFWGSEAAGREGSRNLIGIKDPAIDKLVDNVIFAKDREELVAATNALDRVLLWNDFVVPQWYSPKVRIAYWNRYGQPATLPGLTPGFPQVWWFDKELAAKLPGAPKP